MSLTFILNDGLLEFLNIGSLGPNVHKGFYILTCTVDFRVVACDDGDNDKTFSFFLPFFLYISTSTCEDDKNKSLITSQLLHARTTRTSHSDFNNEDDIYIYIYIVWFDYYRSGLWVWGDLSSGQDIYCLIWLLSVRSLSLGRPTFWTGHICLIWFHTIANEVRGGYTPRLVFECDVWKYFYCLLILRLLILS